MFGYTKMILERLWRVTDHFWDASGRARSVATAEELAVINGIENVIGDWQMGEPLPDAWGLAIRRLRALVESREPVAEDPPAPPAD